MNICVSALINLKHRNLNDTSGEVVNLFLAYGAFASVIVVPGFFAVLYGVKDL